MKQATHWFADKLIDYNQSQDTRMMIIKIPSCEYFELKAQAKEMEKKQIIDAWNGDFADGSEYYNETYGSKGSDECQFEPTTNTSSATICKHCGKEKFLHQ